MGKLSSGRPSQAARRNKTSAGNAGVSEAIAEQIQRGRQGRSEAIRETLAQLPAPRFDQHSESIQHTYPAKLKAWHHTILTGILAGKSHTQIASEVGRSVVRVNQVVNSPLFRSLHDEILRKRYESVVEGEHGVVAQARVEAPHAMTRIVAISKSARSEGVKLDALKHILALAGNAPVVRTETYSLDKLLTEMNLRELETFSTTGRVPRRLAAMIAETGRELPFADDENEPIDVTPTETNLDTRDEPDQE